MKIRILSLFIAFYVIFFIFAGTLHASWFTIKKKKQELYRIQSRLREERERLDTANRKEREIARQLRQVQERLRDTKDKLYQLASSLHFTEGEIRARMARLKYLESERNTKEVQLSQRMFASYRTGEINILGLLFGSENLTDLLNRLNFMGIIINNDVNLLKDIQVKNKAILQEKQTLERKYNDIVSIKQRMNQQHFMESRIETQREEILGDVQAHRRTIANQVVELEETNEQLEAELQKLIRREQAERGSHQSTIFAGAFAWPASTSQITSSFGWRRHPILGSLRFHTGVDIASNYGAPIYASGDGHIIYAGWYGGYGNAVIIDHGGGVSTLYAHCSALYVNAGQDVKKGQTIAATGSTGLANGPHLHFEVRQNGTPVDPMGKF